VRSSSIEGFSKVFFKITDKNDSSLFPNPKNLRMGKLFQNISKLSAHILEYPKLANIFNIFFKMA
jgi:hypothetical protein